MNTWNEILKGWKPAHGIALLALGGLLLAGSAEAKRITVQQAQQNALHFLGKPLVQAQTALSLTRSGKANDAYFVFNSTDGKGYVIVSGDDAVRPILGYSQTGKFDENRMPDGLKDLLASYQKQIEALGDNAPTYMQTRATDQASEKVLTTAKWDQRTPYNEFTPENYPTGCVATSAAILMKYWGYPAKGVGSHSYIWNNTKQLSANFEHAYDWDGMPMEYKKGENDDQFHGVARLMSDIGISVEMDYQKDGSAATTDNLLNSLINNFGYSKYSNLQMWYRYTDSDWKAKIKENINENRPVLYAASDATQGGHIFVIDGYKDELFSVNWGWSGTYDGFYAIGQLAPNEKLNFNLSDQALFDLQPSDGKEIICPLFLTKDMTGFYGLNMNVTDIKAKQTVKLFFGMVACQAANGFTGKLNICIIDKDGNVKENLGYMDIKDFQQGYQYGVIAGSFAAKNNAVAGDRLTLMAQASGSNEMIQLKGFDNADISIPATGYTPRTSTVNFNAEEGATISPLSSNVLYDGKVVQGSNYQFVVQVDNGIAKSFVTVNDRMKISEDKKANSETANDESKQTYSIYEAYEPTYDIHVKTYSEYAEKTAELEVTPGTLEKALADNNLDLFVYRNIKLNGQIDQRDFVALNEKPFKKIDLSGCTVAAYQNYAADYVPASAFDSNETLENFEMPSGVKGLGFNAFLNSTLKKITIPETVQEVGGNCFWYCNNLTDVYMYHTTPLNYHATVFSVGNTDAAKRTLHVPVGCKSVYENSAYQSWTQYFGNIVEDVETGIQGVTINAGDAAVNGKTQKAAIYDLNGRRILTPVKNQTYIQAGKKFIQR